MSNNVQQTLSIIKPDAVERNLAEKIKKIFTENRLNIKDSKKFKLPKKKPLNFIKFIKLNLFIMIYVLIFPQDL